MKIPWVPVTEGAGAFGPVKPTPEFLKSYMTAVNPISHKAFQNLPMETNAPAVKVEKVNKDRKLLPQSTKVREDGEGAGENYVDSFITHPIQGNYEVIIRNLEMTREQTQKALRETNFVTLAEVAEWGYRDLGANADEEKMNSMRDRLRFAGASDEEIESILKERKKERLLASVKIPLSEEQKQVLQAEEMARRAIGAGAIRADAENPGAARAPADANVYNFRNPGAGAYAAFNPVTVPGNNIFAGAARAGVNPAGAPVEIETAGARAAREGRLPRGLSNVSEMVVSGRPVDVGAPIRRPARFPMMRPVSVPESLPAAVLRSAVAPRLTITPLGERVIQAVSEQPLTVSEQLQLVAGRRGRGRPKGSKDTRPRSRPIFPEGYKRKPFDEGPGGKRKGER